MRIYSRFFVLAGLIAFTALPALAREEQLMARSFNPNYILDTSELAQGDSLLTDSIQRFLVAEPGTLAGYHTTDSNGVERSAAEIISNAARAYNISPKFLIVLLQREQSLVEDPSPASRQYDWATGFAVCDDCQTDDPAIQQYKGFALQVDRAAARQRYYLDHPTEFAIQPGVPYVIDGVTVLPVNQATANLYIYTPHLHGNENFWNIWQRYFSRQYPDGSILSDASTHEVWLLQYGERRQFTSLATVYSDYDTAKIITVPHLDLQRYDIGTPIQFAEYSLLRSPKGTIYLLVNDERRGIASHEIFRQLGYNPDEVIDVTWDDLNAYPEGKPITKTDASPVGELWQDSKTGGISYVLDSVRHPIWSRDILKTRFAHYPIRQMKTAVIEKLPISDPAGFRDGELVTSADNPTVFVISNGLRRPIASETIFQNLGYHWENVIRTSERALEANGLGQPLAS